MRKGRDEQAVLLDQRPVETELVLQIGDLFLRGRRPERHARRITGDDPRDQEDDDRQADEDKE